MHGSDYEPPVTPLPFQVKDSGVTAEYADGMRRDTTEGKPRFDLLIPTGMPYEETLLYRAAMHYMLGGKKYGDRNWEKSRTAESLGHHTEALWRHFMKFVSRVEDGEDHAAAIFWNLNAVLYTQWRLEQELAKADASAVQDDDIDDVDEDLPKIMTVEEAFAYADEAANPSDDDVVIAEDVLRRRQAFYTREAQKLFPGTQAEGD